ncbi:hypothetical protein DFH06DRAFT_1294817 [Mycena polygramma]|nr:hypothetical protein DFH06DRAFT_1294817 [Mycena polygramma]
MALTSDSLPNLPKLDKNHFISSYLQGQRAHAKSHAEEGRFFSTSWDIHPTPRKPSPALHNVGFATPILTARIPRPAEEQESKKENISADKKTHPNKKPNDNSDKASKPPKPVSKKRGADPLSDEDHAARLTERRERKRIKRAIVQPKEVTEPDTASSNGNAKHKKGVKGKGKKPKVPSGFALMHGFSATNVGKNRLTLKPPSKVGVFKKGKASFNAKTKPKPKGSKPDHFSEYGFLNNLKKAPGKPASETSGSDSTLASEEGLPTPRKKVLAPKHRQIVADKQGSELSKFSASAKRPSAESEIWDIESCASQKRKLILEKMGSMDEASAIYRQGTVVMDARMPAWSNRVAEASGRDPNQTTLQLPDPVVIPSSPSLRPSQSASQIGIFAKPNPVEAASRYFPPNHQRQPAQPLAPDSNGTKPHSSIVGNPEPVEIHQHVDEDVVVEPVNHPPSDVPVLPARFVVPPRNRVFAKQFVSVQAVRSQSQDSCIYPSPVPVPDIPLEDSQDLDYYAWEPDLEHGMSPEILDSDYGCDEEQYSFTEEPCPGDFQLCDYQNAQSSEGWDADTAPWVDSYDDGLVEFAVEYENAVEHAGYLDLIDEEGDAYIASSHAESDSGASYGQWGSPYVDMDIGNEAATAGFDCWQENSMCVADDSTSFDDGSNLLEDELIGQGYSAVACDSVDSSSECSDSTSAPHFAEGRALLMGLALHESAGRGISAHLSNAEVDVIKSLRGHWFPQRL